MNQGLSGNVRPLFLSGGAIVGRTRGFRSSAGVNRASHCFEQSVCDFAGRSRLAEQEASNPLPILRTGAVGANEILGRGANFVEAEAVQPACARCLARPDPGNASAKSCHRGILSEQQLDLVGAAIQCNIGCREHLQSTVAEVHDQPCGGVDGIIRFEYPYGYLFPTIGDHEEFDAAMAPVIHEGRWHVSPLSSNEAMRWRWSDAISHRMPRHRTGLNCGGWGSIRPRASRLQRRYCADRFQERAIVHGIQSLDASAQQLALANLLLQA